MHGFIECRCRWSDPEDVWSGAVDLDLLYLGREALAAVHGGETSGSPSGSTTDSLRVLDRRQPVATLSGAKHCVQSPGCRSPRLITVVSEPG